MTEVRMRLQWVQHSARVTETQRITTACPGNQYVRGILILMTENTNLDRIIRKHNFRIIVPIDTE